MLISGLGVLVSTCQFTTLCVQLVSDLIDTISLIPMSRGSYGAIAEDDVLTVACEVVDEHKLT